MDSLGAGVHRADPVHPDHPRHHLIPPAQAAQHRGGETQVEYKETLPFQLKYILSISSTASLILFSAANRLIGEVVQSRRRPLLGPSPG